MKEIKALVKEIHNGKEIEQNCKRYEKRASQCYMDYAALELVFSSYVFFEECKDEKSSIALRENEMVQKLKSGLQMVSTGQIDSDKLVQEMTQIRSYITGRMECFTCYTDHFILYEHVLNRLEYSFLPAVELEKRLKKYSKLPFMEKLIMFLLQTKDKAVMTENIRTVIGQLPVRTTKAKFYEQLSQALMLYQGGDRSAFDGFVYMIESSGILKEPASITGEYEEFAGLLTKLEVAPYDNMSLMEYEELVKALELGAKDIQEVTDFYYSIQRIANQVLAIAIGKKYVETDSTLYSKCTDIIDHLLKDSVQDVMLVPLEGKIEGYVTDTSYLEAVLYDIKNTYQDILIKQDQVLFFHDLVSIANLLSDSLFIELEQDNEEVPMDAASITEATTKLINRFDEKMKQVQKPVRRAIMAKVLEKLPMIFKSQEQLKEYIETSLFDNQNSAEKLTVLEILEGLMKED